MVEDGDEDNNQYHNHHSADPNILMRRTGRNFIWKQRSNITLHSSERENRHYIFTCHQKSNQQKCEARHCFMKVILLSKCKMIFTELIEDERCQLLKK